MFNSYRLLTVLIFFSITIPHSVFAWEKVIYLTRHGETYANRDHVNIGQKLDPRVVLTEKGMSHAKSLGDFLAQEGIQRIYVSRLARTHQTAMPLADKLRLTPLIDPNLDELNLGQLEGDSLDSKETQAQFKKENEDCHFRFGKGESRLEMGRRLEQFVRTFSQPTVPDIFLIVGHFGTVRELLSFLLQLPCKDAGKIFPSNTDVFRLTNENGHIKKLEVSRERKPFEEIKAENLMQEPPAFVKPKA